MAGSCDNEKYLDFSDEELAALSQGGNTEALEFILGKYRGFVRRKARAYFLVGADREDIVQEGMIGLFKAVRDFNPEKQSSFKVFADLCVTRQIITAVKTATRQKHIPLNSYVSLNKPLFDEAYEITLLDVLGKDITTNPEDIVITREKLKAIDAKLGEMLSAFECKVLSLYLQGKSYQEIGGALGKESKSIDNALQRIKKKVEKIADMQD